MCKVESCDQAPRYTSYKSQRITRLVTRAHSLKRERLWSTLLTASHLCPSPEFKPVQVHGYWGGVPISARNAVLHSASPLRRRAGSICQTHSSFPSSYSPHVALSACQHFDVKLFKRCLFVWMQQQSHNSNSNSKGIGLSKLLVGWQCCLAFSALEIVFLPITAETMQTPLCAHKCCCSHIDSLWS